MDRMFSFNHTFYSHYWGGVSYIVQGDRPSYVIPIQGSESEILGFIGIDLVFLPNEGGRNAPQVSGTYLLI